MSSKALALTKEFLVLFIPYILIITTFMGSLIYFDQHSQIEIMKGSTSNHVNRHKERIKLKLSSISSDLNFLSNMNELNDFVRFDSDANKEKLQQELLTFIRFNSIYAHIRLLNDTGFEVVRINSNDSNPEVVKDSDLQDKAHRYYFNETILQKPGDTYISPFDLNVEQGKIEHPIKPVIRFGMPIFDDFNQLKAVLIVSYLGNDLLNVFYDSSDGLIGDSLFLNDDGYYIASPDADKNWGFMYPELQKETFKVSHQFAWDKISNQDSGQFLADDEMFTFNTIYPYSVTPSESHSLATDRGENTAWKLVTKVNLNDPRLNSNSFSLLIYGLLFLLALLGAFTCWLLARSKTRVKETTEALANNLKTVKQNQEDMIQNENLAFQGRMVSGFAHEVNTPIGIAVSASSLTFDTGYELQKEITAKTLNEKLLINYVETIHESAEITLLNLQKASDLIQSFHRSSTHQNSGELCIFNVRTLVDDVLLTLLNEFKPFDIDVQIQCSPSLNVYSTPGLLEKTLIHLIQNTLAHAFIQPADNQCIQIHIRLISDQLAIDYFDNGEGMPNDIRRKIFEPFFTTTNTGTGTGLGLFIVRDIISIQLGGNINCTSTIGEGTTFYLRYPVDLLYKPKNELIKENDQISVPVL